VERVRLLFDYSPWFVGVCLIAGALYAALLYLRGQSFVNKSWGKRINYSLTALRFLLVTLLCLLLVGPFIRQIKNTVESPLVVFAIDNSASLAAIEDSAKLDALKQQLAQVADGIQEADYEVEFKTFDGSGSLDTLKFNHQSSDLNGMLSDIASDYEGRNLASVVLFSDGIYNQGISPTYTPFRFLVNTVGLGDTIPKRDINLKNLYYNKITYQGNKFPVVAEVLNTGFAGQNVTVRITKQGRVIASKEVKLASERELNRVEFLLDAEKEGMQHYVVEIEPIEEEFTTQNNIAHAYIDVIEGKEKILLVAAAPHPDIKAIRSAIEGNQNYELQIHIPSLSATNEKQKLETRYDLIIFHQLPENTANSLNLLKEFQEKSDAHWYIVGNQTYLPRFNQENPVISVISINNDVDEVKPVYNNAFSLFKIEAERQAIIEQYLPITVPFGNLEPKGNQEVLLYQKVGNVETTKPLLVVRESDGKKSAALLGEGFWQWRMQEFSRHDKTEAFDDMVGKLVQYLSAKEDKRKFKVYPVSETFEDTQPVVFETELYNDIYEQIYGQPVSLTITGEDGTQKKFSYTTNENNTQYRVSNLPEGVYQYQASTNINGQEYTSGGEFTVQRLQIENLNLTANHQLLRQLSEETGGNFYTASELDQVAEATTQQQAKNRIYTSEAYLPIINLKWIFFLLLLLVSLEWGIRKYMGSY
jgi:hypothetical protein